MIKKTGRPKFDATIDLQDIKYFNSFCLENCYNLPKYTLPDNDVVYTRHINLSTAHSEKMHDAYQMSNQEYLALMKTLPVSPAVNIKFHE